MPTKRRADCTPEEYALIRERAREAQKRYDQTEKGRERNRLKLRSKWARRGDELKAKKREYQKRVKVENPEHHKALAVRKRARNQDAERKRSRRRHWRDASQRRAKDLMLELHRMISPTSSRDEIVAEAAMLIMEGFGIEKAVEIATKKIVSYEYKQKFTKPLDECYWL